MLRCVLEPFSATSAPMIQPPVRNLIESARLLFVSRDSALVRTLWSLGESSSWQLEIVGNVWEAMERVQSGGSPDLLLLDLPQGDADGLHILRWLRRLRPALPIILIGHPGDLRKRQELIRLGARDYLVRPLDDRRLTMVIQNHLSMVCETIEPDITSEDVDLISDDTFFIAISPIMRELRAQAVSLAQVNVPVLILGEGGSGKETTARLVHKLSLRSGFQFTKVNCAALPGDLLERELFGCEWDGTSTPVSIKAGKLELGVKGTILLDEITEMPIGIQANLVRVLQNRRFMRPGTSAAVEVDIRVLASSTTNMEHAVSEKRFRKDLYYLLSAYTIHVPPLRERREEVRLLSRHFMHKLAKQYALSPRDFSPAALEACQAYSWPGNLRELEIFVKRYLMTGDKELVFEKSRPDLDKAAGKVALASLRDSNDLQSSSVIQARVAVTGTDSLRSVVQSVKLEAERNAIAAALQKTGWNRKAAARLLKVSYRTLLYKIDQYQIKASDLSLLPGDTGLKGKRNGFRGNTRTD
jgi:two-component system, NtrC family, response regulator AtoC